MEFVDETHTHAGPITAEMIQSAKVALERQDWTPLPMIVHPKQYDRLDWYYRVIWWDRSVNWDRLVAPRLTRFLRWKRRQVRRFTAAWQVFRDPDDIW